MRGGWAPAWGVSPAGLLFHALGEYLDPAGDRDRNGPHMGVLNISGDHSRGLSAQGGHE